MAPYQFYKLDKAGRIEGLPETIDCADDVEATEKAKTRARQRCIEIWRLCRRVAVIEVQKRER